MMENTRMPVSHQMQMEVSRGDLYLNGETYQKQIQPPSIKDYLLTSKQQEDQLDRIQTMEVKSETKNGSHFQKLNLYKRYNKLIISLNCNMLVQLILCVHIGSLALNTMCIKTILMMAKLVQGAECCMSSNKLEPSTSLFLLSDTKQAKISVHSTSNCMQPMRRKQ